MEDQKYSLHLSFFVPLFSLIPITLLTFLAYRAFDAYFRGIERIVYNHRNLYETMWIGGVVWTVTAISLVVLLGYQIILQRKGKDYKFPHLAISLAAAWNLLILAHGFNFYAIICGLDWYVPAENVLNYALTYSSITFGLIISGVASIKYESLKKESGLPTFLLCLVNFTFSSIGAFLLYISFCGHG